MCRVYRKTISFTSRRVLRSVGFRVEGARGVTIIKQGNYNGAALLGLVRKSIRLSGESDSRSVFVTGTNGPRVNCLGRVTFRSPFIALRRRIHGIFTPVRHQGGRLRTTTRTLRVSCSRRTIAHCATVRRGFGRSNKCCFRGRCSMVVHGFNFSRRRQGGPLSRFSNKRRAGVTFVGLLLDGPSVLLLSRPAGRLSVAAVR